MSQFGLSPIQKDPLEYAGRKTAVIPTVDAPRAPTILDRKHPIQTIWRDNTTNDEWILVDVINGDAQWRLFTGGGFGTVTNLQADDGNTAYPNVGVIDIDANTVAAATHAVPFYTTAAVANTIDIDLQVASAQAATDINNAGLCSFSDAHFTVDANGYVELAGGGLAVDQINVDFATAPGTDPVVPDGTGEISIIGATVANATNANAPVATHSRAVNAFNLEVQVSAAVAATPADNYDAGLSSYDQTHFNVDANGFTQLVYPSPPVQGYFNFGVSYNGGTGVFTIHGSDGTSLSATNPGYVTFSSKSTPGQLITIPVTANQSFIDDVGASEIIGNLFGLTTGIAFNTDMPFFIYAVCNDAEDAVAFGISRIPHRNISSAAANIGTPSSATADIQGSIFLFEDVTIADYDSNPCIVMGGIRMQMSAADDWTVQALTVDDGIGEFYDQYAFYSVEGQFGAVANSYFSSSAGGDTIPTFNNDGIIYWINKDGMAEILFGAPTCGANGVGAGNLRLHVPFQPRLSDTVFGYTGSLTWLTAGGNYSMHFPSRNSGAGVNYFFFITDGAGIVTPAQILAVDQLHRCVAYYRILA